MKYAFLSLALLIVLALPVQASNGVVRSGGALIINNNNNNARQANVQAARVRARRPVLRFLFPRAALRRDAIFGQPVDRFGRVR